MGQLCSCHSGKASGSSKGFPRPWSGLLQKRPPTLPALRHKRSKTVDENELRGCYDNLHFDSNSPNSLINTRTNDPPSPSSSGQPCNPAEGNGVAGSKDEGPDTPEPVGVAGLISPEEPPTLRKRAFYRANRWAGGQSLNLPGDLDISRYDGDGRTTPGWLRKKPKRAQSVSLCEDRWGRERLVEGVKDWLCDRIDPWILFQRLQEFRTLSSGLAMELGRCTTEAESCRCLLDFVVSLSGEPIPNFRIVRQLLSPDSDERPSQILEFLEVSDALLDLTDFIRFKVSPIEATDAEKTFSSEEALPDSSGTDLSLPCSSSTRTLTANRQTPTDGCYFRAEIVGTSSTRPCLYELGCDSADKDPVPIAREPSFSRRRHSDLFHSDEFPHYGRGTKDGDSGPPPLSIAIYNIDLNSEIVEKLKRIVVGHSQVRHVSIVQTRISKESFVELCQVFHRPPPGLVHFDFRMNHLVEDSWTCLGAGLRLASSLNSLNLSSTGMTGEECRRLVEALVACGSINRVFSELDLGYNELDDLGCRAVAEFIESPVCWLRKLRIRHNSISPDGIKRLAAALSCHPRLTLLDVSSNPIGNEGATAILESLLSNRTLRDLALDDCGLTTDGCRPLARALKTNSVLRTLTLSRNGIGDAGVGTVAEGLRYNRTIEVLGIDMCGVGNEGFARLLQELHWCHSVRLVKACYNRISLPTESIGSGVPRRWSSASVRVPEPPAYPEAYLRRNPKAVDSILVGDVYAQLCEVLRVNPKMKIFLWGNRADDGVSSGALRLPSTGEQGPLVLKWHRSQTVDDSGYGTLSRETVATRL